MRNTMATRGLLRIVFFIAGILFSIFFMLMAIKNMEWQNVQEVISNAQLYPWILFAVLCYLAGHCLRGLRTKLLVSNDSNLSVVTASNIVVVGYAVNNILPVRIGELARAGMLTERTGLSFAQSITVVLLERLFDGIAIVLLLTGASYFLNTWTLIEKTVLFSSFIFGIAVIGLLIIILVPNRLLAVTSKSASRINPRWHDSVLRFMMGIVNGVNYLRIQANPGKILLLSMVIWFCDAGLFLLVMPAFGSTLTIVQATFVMAVTNLGILIPSGPGHIIPFRSFCIKGLTFLGIAPATATGFAMVVQLAIYISLMLWGGAVIIWYCVRLALTINLTKRGTLIDKYADQFSITANLLGSTAAEKMNEVSSPFIYSLVEAAVPIDSVVLSDQRVVISYTASFIQGEIKSLPKKFQILLKIGMAGFGALVRLRYFQSFIHLPLPTRVAIFNAWAYGSVSVTRQLFKLIRSTALLAFFEHPAVVTVLENRHCDSR